MTHEEILILIQQQIADTQEMKDRLRRIETRLTSFMEQNGFDTGSKKPEWRQDHVVIPSMSARLDDILAVIPVTSPMANIIHKTKRVASLGFYKET
jgi:hypothetical protein